MRVLVAGLRHDPAQPIRRVGEDAVDPELEQMQHLSLLIDRVGLHREREGVS